MAKLCPGARTFHYQHEPWSDFDEKAHGLLIVSFLLMPSLSSAQDRCPEGFHYVGTLSGTDSEQFDKTVVLELPELATLDESYQQTKVRATNGRGKAKLNLRPQDIPKAFTSSQTGRVTLTRSGL